MLNDFIAMSEIQRRTLETDAWYRTAAHGRMARDSGAIGIGNSFHRAPTRSIARWFTLAKLSRRTA